MQVETAKFALCAQLMAASEEAVIAGIKGMTGCLDYFAGADEETASITNISIWDSLNSAQEMDRFQPLLDLDKRLSALGTRF